MTNEGLNRPALIKAGIVLAAVAVLANIPYAALIALFDYDDALRLRRPGGLGGARAERGWGLMGRSVRKKWGQSLFSS